MKRSVFTDLGLPLVLVSVLLAAIHFVVSEQTTFLAFLQNTPSLFLVGYHISIFAFTVVSMLWLLPPSLFFILKWVMVPVSLLLSLFIVYSLRVPFFQASTFYWSDKQFLLLWLLDSLFLFSCFYIFYSRRSEEKKLQDARQEELKKVEQEMELKKIKTLWQPHFLFNSLNSIQSLLYINTNEGIHMLQQLSDFLRMNVQQANEEWVRCEDEWKNINLYLAIEQVRFQDRLRVETEMDERCLAKKIPSFILQPIFENAIKYGLYGTLQNVVFHFSMKQKEDGIYFQLRNPYETDTMEKRGEGFGISGIRRRLYLLYGRNDLVHIEKNEHTFTITLHLPQTE